MPDALIRSMFARRAFLYAGMGFLGANVFGPVRIARAAGPAGAVEQVQGAAKAELEGKLRELRKAEQVFFGDMVSTEDRSLLALRLGERTTLKLGPRAQMRIDRYLADAGGEFDLVSGPMMFERTGPKAKGDIQFRSAYGLMAVRGTRFYAGMSRGKFGVLVGSGRVDVTAGGQTVSVDPQQGTDIAAPGAPPSPAKAWPYERVAEMLAEFR